MQRGTHENNAAEEEEEEAEEEERTPWSHRKGEGSEGSKPLSQCG